MRRYITRLLLPLARVTGALPAYTLRKLASWKRDRSSPISASTRAPVSAPRPEKLVMIAASGCTANASWQAAAKSLNPFASVLIASRGREAPRPNGRALPAPHPISDLHPAPRGVFLLHLELHAPDEVRDSCSRESFAYDLRLGVPVIPAPGRNHPSGRTARLPVLRTFLLVPTAAVIWGVATASRRPARAATRWLRRP